MRGVPDLLRPVFSLGRAKNRVPGTDIAGTVEAVGKSVTQLRPGDEVFGWCKGAFAEYVSVSEGALALKPATLPFDASCAASMRWSSPADKGGWGSVRVSAGGVGSHSGRRFVIVRLLAFAAVSVANVLAVASPR